MIFITGSENKVKEFREILGIDITSRNLNIEEIQDVDIKKVAEYKARKAYEILKEPVLVEDTGLFFDALNGLPGAFIKHFLERLSKQEICDMLKKNRKAIAKTCICYFDGKDLKFFEGALIGEIALSPRGENGFGFDHIFIKEGGTKTLAEIENKNDISMRKLALEKLKCLL